MGGLISIIVPIYNVDQYLDKCIESIVSQTYGNLEIILIDDGSPDNCPTICDSWCKRDSRIKVIHKVNGGLSDARNAGIKIATGDYIAFIDSDDWIENNYIKKMYEYMMIYEADIVECGVTYVSENGEKVRTRKTDSLLKLNLTQELCNLVIEDNVFQTVWNKLYKRKIVEGIFFEKGKYNEDDFWTYQVMDRLNQMIVIEDELYNYVQRGTSIMGNSFNYKRMDGLDARVLRMKYFENDKIVGTLAREKIWIDYLFFYQCVIKYLNGEERKKAITKIENYMKTSMLDSKNFRCTSVKYKIWLKLFSNQPYLVAKIRNKLGIGL